MLGGALGQLVGLSEGRGGREARGVTKLKAGLVGYAGLEVSKPLVRSAACGGFAGKTWGFVDGALYLL